ncbi:hypothetical protein ACFVSN_02250 [Kitasatospora sp. NPDC057904]|uniref:T4 family baseplate hub assembly chaperone n=1 Tax=unclassified Kitasatospora TaxID=2633591 RepID=UPI0036DD00C4
MDELTGAPADVTALTEEGLLAVWEAGRGQDPVRRALVLAAAGGGDPAAVADLAVGRREELVLGLRVRCFGPGLPCAVTCPSCRTELELELTAQDVTAAAPEGERVVRAGGFELAFRPVTTRDLLAVRGAPRASARRALLRRVLTSAVADGRPVAADALPADVLEAVAGALAGRDPQADVRLDLDCAECGHAWTSPFDASGYLWAELDAHARRLLHDVHALATAYGWTEAEVLAVGPERRQLYLELVTA